MSPSIVPIARIPPLLATVLLALTLFPAIRDVHAKAETRFGPAVDAFCATHNRTQPFAERKCVMCHNPLNLKEKIQPQWTWWDARQFANFCNRLPDSRIDEPAADVTIPRGGSVTFRGTGLDADGPTPLTYRWILTGGNPPSSALAAPGPVSFPSHGSFSVSFTALDSQGRADQTPARRRVTVVDPACVDGDFDGFYTGGGVCGPVDCNDSDPGVFPGAPEVCGDGLDNDCNGLADRSDGRCIPGQDCLVQVSDADGDGIPDASDNCTLVPNANQRDSNGDGFGNVCDGDLNNDGLVTAADFAILRSRLNTGDADADLNGDGLVTAADALILRNGLNKPPGPSGLVGP